MLVGEIAGGKMLKRKNVLCNTFLYYNMKDGEQTDLGIKPVFKTKGAAAADVAIPYDVTIPAKSSFKVDLMIGFEIAEGSCIKMYPRSSLLINYGLLSPVTIIDWDYRFEHVHWQCFNLTDHDVHLEKGTRVAQIMLLEQSMEGDWERENTVRTGGHGSTGV